MKAAPAVGFRYRPSRMLLAATAAVALLAIVASWLVHGPAWLHILSSVLVVGYVIAAIHAWMHPPITSLLWRADGGVELHLRERAGNAGEDVLGVLQGARVLGPLIVLTLRWPPRDRATIWLLPDNLDGDTRRRLRMRLSASAGSLASGNADSG